jgi:hypothetical protein
LVFSPAEKNVERPDPMDTEEDRKEYEIRRAEYMRERGRFVSGETLVMFF